MNLEKIMLTERSQILNVTYCLILFIYMPGTDKPTETENRLVLPGARGRGEWGVTTHGYWVWGEGSDENVLKLDSSGGCIIL